jgi:alanyl-tRNA synthetase
VAAGVRRVEAVAGAAAETYIREQLGQLHEVKELLKHPKDLLKSLENLQQEHSELRKKLESMETRHLNSLALTLAAEQESINGIRFVGAIVEAGSADSLKKLCFDLKNRLENNYVVILAASIDGKAQVALMLDEAISQEKQLEAPALIKQYIAGLIKGGGGGQKTLATAGGQDASNLPLVIGKIREILL